MSTAHLFHSLRAFPSTSTWTHFSQNVVQVGFVVQVPTDPDKNQKPRLAPFSLFRLPLPIILQKTPVEPTSTFRAQTMKIRTYQPGDEAIQAEIYNEAAKSLPKVKPANVDEVKRRCQAADFDPATRFYAEDGGRVVGYAMHQSNGRTGYPWCRPGSEAAREPLFAAMTQAMSARGISQAFAAYRGDWPDVLGFFEQHGFRQARDMMNYVLELCEMPTRMERPMSVSPLKREDIPALLQLAPKAPRVTSATAMEKHCFDNPYFSPESFFAIRQRKTGALAAVGLFILNPSYADPRQIDPGMPCFRLGAFGTEGMTAKRVNGLFSVLTTDDFDGLGHANQLMSYAAQQAENAGLEALAGQVPSDVPHLARFFKQYFRFQASFPVLEKSLTGGV